MRQRHLRITSHLVAGLLLGLLLSVAGASIAEAQTDAAAEQGYLQLSLVDEPTRLGRHLFVLEDPTGELTLDDVRSPDYAAAFRRVDGPTPNYGFTDSAYWVRLRLWNSTAGIEDWRLELPVPFLDDVTFFHPDDDGRYVALVTGASRRLDTRDIPVAVFAFDVPLPPGRHQELFLRLQNNGSLTIPLSIMPAPVFQHQRGVADIFWGGTLGTLLVVSIYYLLLNLHLRDRRVVWLALVSGVGFVYFLSLSGYGAMLLWPDSPWLSRPLRILGLQLLMFGMLRFTMEIVRAPLQMPSLDRLLSGFSVALLATTVFALFLPLNRFVAAQQWLVLLTLVIIGVLVLVGVWRRDEASKLLLPALVVLFLGTALAAFTTLGLQTVAIGANLRVAVGLALFLMLVGRVLGLRAKQLRAERQEATRVLQEERSRYQAILDNQPDIILRMKPNGVLTFVNQSAAAFIGRTRDDMLDSPLYSFLPPDQGNYLRRNLQAISPQQPIVVDERDFIDNNGDPRRLRVVMHGTFDAKGNVTEIQNVAHDVTEQRRVERELARYRDQLEERVALQTAALNREEQLASGLASLSTALSTSLELERVLDVILQQVSQIRGCDGVALLVRDGDELVAIASSGIAAEVGHVRYSLDDDNKIMVRAFNQGEPIVIQNTLESEQWPHGPGDYAPRAVIAIPLRSPNGMVGLLGVGSHQPDAFDPTTLELLMAYATHAAIAINNARLFTAAQEAATREERERLARDLHDAVTQTLFSASILAEAVPLLINVDPDAAALNIEKLQHLTRGALGEMRALLVELKPSMLLDASLGSLLTYLADATKTRSRLDVQVLVNGEPPELPSDVQIAFYRIAQEALNNIIKHAQASVVHIELADTREGIVLTVVDDGLGIRKKSSGGMGLRIMRERAEVIGATLSIDSTPGDGTTLRLVWSEVAP